MLTATVGDDVLAGCILTPCTDPLTGEVILTPADRQDSAAYRYAYVAMEAFPQGTVVQLHPGSGAAGPAIAR